MSGSGTVSSPVVPCSDGGRACVVKAITGVVIEFVVGDRGIGIGAHVQTVLTVADPVVLNRRI